MSSECQLEKAHINKFLCIAFCLPFSTSLSLIERWGLEEWGQKAKKGGEYEDKAAIS